ncbi:MAG TPA: hypothetical protein VGT24_07865 [Candidatus Acidoferrales bacterium]|nr:hypothetical protein [Candidatus Acidoferrales bacterium]
MLENTTKKSWAQLPGAIVITIQQNKNCATMTNCPSRKLDGSLKLAWLHELALRRPDRSSYLDNGREFDCVGYSPNNYGHSLNISVSFDNTCDMNCH